MKIIGTLIAFLAFSAACAAQIDYKPDQRGSFCMNPSGQWIPINSSFGAALGNIPPRIGLFGSTDPDGTAGTWHPLNCDANGNITALPAGWISNGATDSTQVITAPGTVAAPTIQSTTNGVKFPDNSVQTSASSPSSIYFSPGDVICALHADTSIGAVAITAVASNATTMTYTMASVPAYFRVGQIVSSQGNTTVGYNAAPLVIASTDSTHVVVTSSANPGAGTGGGTLSLYCSNQVTDGSAALTAFATTVTIPANTWGVSRSSLEATEQYTFFTTSSPATVLFSLSYGSTTMSTSGAVATPQANLTTGGNGWHKTLLGFISPSLVKVSTGPTNFGNTMVADPDGYGPIAVASDTQKVLNFKIKYSAATAGNAIVLDDIVTR